MAHLHAASDVMWFCNRDFVIPAARAHQLFGDKLITRSGTGLYKRTCHDARMEAKAISRVLSRFGMALQQPTPTRTGNKA
jgi:hypothetical protein